MPQPRAKNQNCGEPDEGEVCHPGIGRLSHDLAKRGGSSQHAVTTVTINTSAIETFHI